MFNIQEFDGTMQSRNYIFDEVNEEKSPPFSPSANQLFLTPSPFVTDWSNLSKFNNMSAPLSPDKSPLLRPISKSVIIPRKIPSMFQFNVDREHLLDSNC